jgi:chromate reductase
MNISIICTSPREGSQTLRFGQYLKSIFENQDAENKISIIDFEDFDIPAIGKGKVDPNNLSVYQSKLIQIWAKSDLIVFCSPEYNWTTNGEVFIMFDQLGSKNFEYLFENKVFAFAGVSSGRGGKIAALDVSKVVNKLVSFQNKLSIVSPKIYESHETGKNILEDFKSSGNIVFEAGVLNFVQYSLALTNKWIRSNA